ncbi:uncharacterized protein [Palaemon carinicauda]|uniref:uncharacterized protein n=1 Tax=Palaemon carinicauda TaxID=392227 RepID=UPI0035B5D349
MLQNLDTFQVLLSDNAPKFTSEVMKKLCKFFEIKKCEITPYKTSSNGTVERANKKILDVLQSTISPTTGNWDIPLEDVQFTLNNTLSQQLLGDQKTSLTLREMTSFARLQPAADGSPCEVNLLHALWYGVYPNLYLLP